MIFALVGIAGFIVDALVLYLFKDFLGLYISRLISFLAAVVATWVLNRQLTFRQMSSSLTKKKEFAHYLFLCSLVVL
ncbi:GtrA family protein [Duffyella gerundensis]|uniref:GtrA family protein n=1 Tax=Duffyella gerundensis TaxID=1619313 RepID=UPI0021F71884|nr:GtrA family protein [Duffyella gerundensis]